MPRPETIDDLATPPSSARRQAASLAIIPECAAPVAVMRLMSSGASVRNRAAIGVEHASRGSGDDQAASAKPRAKCPASVSALTLRRSPVHRYANARDDRDVSERQQILQQSKRQLDAGLTDEAEIHALARDR